ncbi:hypothetical protein WICMUC_001324 [Wickerhamomyces mucosus]|uniref:Karyogamy protein n=1 Tax=Wickerhamomyces mucosus TaxID=1378264 RepID=A0A9P8PV92_9ASCO|nr:hypothetical protein WICMUC_001324 [Wickerhamomyces mucosus]
MQELSGQLANAPTFDFFKSIVDLEPYDPAKLISVTNELLAYTNQITNIFFKLNEELIHNDMDLLWYAEGKTRFYDIFRNVDSIDSIMLQIINLLESNLDSQKENFLERDIFDKIDILAESSLNLKREHFVPFKTKIDLSTEFDEFNSTMNSINRELENCLKLCFRIHEKRFSSPVRHAPRFNLEMLTKKLLKQRSNLRLPLLNEIDNELYQEYLNLKTIVDPLKVSLEFIPQRIEEFKLRYVSQLNAIDVNTLNEKYNSLIKELSYLTNEVNDLKYEIVDKRWDEIFSYLNTEMSFMIMNIEKELKKLEELTDNGTGKTLKAQLFKRIKYTIEIIENTFILINTAIDEKLIHIRVIELSNELAMRWLHVKDQIPQEYLDKIEQGIDMNNVNNDDEDLTQNLKKLSLNNSNNESGELYQKKLSETPVKEKRRSRAGQFLIGKLNLVPVLVENDPTSVRKPAELNPYNGKVLTDSLKQNQIDDTNLRKDSVFSNIPDLSKVDHFEKNSKTFSPIKEVDTPSSDRYDHLHDSDVFDTPIQTVKQPKHVSSIPKTSKIPVPKPSRIPKPSSRTSSDRASLSSFPEMQPIISGNISSSRQSMLPPSTPIRRNDISRRKSMLHQPTPLKDLLKSPEENRRESLGRSLSAIGTRTNIPGIQSSGLNGRSISRAGSRSASRAGNRSGTSMSDSRPVWK